LNANSSCCVSLVSLPDHSVDENASDNDVFHSKDLSVSPVHFTDIENKLRRVTVSGGSPTRLHSPLSAMDLATVRSASNARPKSLFPRTDRGNAPDWSSTMAKPVKTDIGVSTNDQRSDRTQQNCHGKFMKLVKLCLKAWQAFDYILLNIVKDKLSCSY